MKHLIKLLGIIVISFFLPATAMPGTLAAGAALPGMTAAAPGPHSPFAGILSGAMALGAAGFGLYAYFSA